MEKKNTIIYNFIRNQLKKTIMGNMGKVYEEEDLLTCIVNKKNKFNEEELGYRKFFNYRSDVVKDLSIIYNLEKQKKYIIQNIDFDKKVYITCHNNCDIIIKNCKFDKGLIVENIKGNCNIENCYIKNDNAFFYEANELILNRVTVYCDCYDTVRIIGNNKLSIIDSVINSNEKDAELYLCSYDEINIEGKSSIFGGRVTCKSDFLFMDDLSKIEAEKIIKFNVMEFDKINAISPYIKFNNNDVRELNQHDFVTLKKLEEPLSIKRLQLIDTLKLIKEKCEKINEKKLEKVNKYLDNRPITKILK